MGKRECLNTFWMRFESVNEGQCGVNVRVSATFSPVVFEAVVFEAVVVEGKRCAFSCV